MCRNRYWAFKIKAIKLFLGLLIVLTFIGCDSIRVVRITNKTKTAIEIRTDFPQYKIFEEDTDGIYSGKVLFDKNIYLIREKYKDIQIDTFSEGLIIKLKPLQYFDIAGHIGTGLVKIKSWDLNYSKLTIYTSTDTIIAKNKDEIIGLFDNLKTKYIRRIDKQDIKTNNKCWKNIVIR